MPTKSRQFVFFDSKKVISATTKAERRVLSRFGAFVRTRAKQSIRRRKRVSRPGSPPTSRTGYLKRGIFYGYDVADAAVVIGPVRGGKRGEATHALEFGNSQMEARPYMNPALEHELPKLPQLWKNAIRP